MTYDMKWKNSKPIRGPHSRFPDINIFDRMIRWKTVETGVAEVALIRRERLTEVLQSVSAPCFRRVNNSLMWRGLYWAESDVRIWQKDKYLPVLVLAQHILPR